MPKIETTCIGPDTSALHGLYILTDARLGTGARLSAAVAQALDGGARVVQFRDKSSDRRQRLQDAEALAALCQSRNAILIINDDIELALAVGAHGVHVGREDAPLRQARARLGDHALIGVSCYDDLQRAETAAAEGASYVAFGSFYASAVKPDAVRAPLALLRQARARLSIPIAAIGGITTENGAALIANGADMLAVITGVFGAQDIRAAAAAYARLFPA